MLSIGTLADGKLGTTLASLYSPGIGQSAHVFVNMANSSSANTYSVSIGIKRSGSTNTRLVIGAGTLIIAASSSNTNSGLLCLPPSPQSGFKLSSGDSLMGSCSDDAVIHYVIHGGVET